MVFGSDAAINDERKTEALELIGKQMKFANDIEILNRLFQCGDMTTNEYAKNLRILNKQMQF